MGLAARFALWVSLALALVMLVAGSILFERTQVLVDRKVDQALSVAAEEQAFAAKLAAKGEAHARPLSNRVTVLNHGVQRSKVEILAGRHKGLSAQRYASGEQPGLIVPIDDGSSKQDLFSLFAFVTGAVILVGAGVASLIALRVSQPLESLLQDVRTIARGNLNHKTHVRTSGEVRELARAIDKMGDSLADAQGSQVELGIRVRERQLALQLAQAFLPSEEPWIDGYRVTGKFMASNEPGGGFFDYCQVDGKTAFWVCDVSGQGVPGSLVGATARAYLRTALQACDDLSEALTWVNRELHRDVERGLFVTTLVVVLDPIEHVAQVACAGHKLPLLRWDAAESQLKSLQPNGFALGFDGGSVFDKRLEVIRIPCLPGDRLVLAGQGIAAVCKENKQEWGEKGLYRTLAKYAPLGPEALLQKIQDEAQAFAGSAAQSSDYSLVIMTRDSE